MKHRQPTAKDYALLPCNKCLTYTTHLIDFESRTGDGDDAKVNCSCVKCQGEYRPFPLSLVTIAPIGALFIQIDLAKDPCVFINGERVHSDEEELIFVRTLLLNKEIQYVLKRQNWHESDFETVFDLEVSDE